MLTDARIRYAARHRHAISIAIGLIGSLVGFFVLGGGEFRSGNVLAAGSWALGLWIGAEVMIYGLGLTAAPRDE